MSPAYALDDRIATLTLDDGKVNAMSLAFFQDLTAGDVTDADDKTKALTFSLDDLVLYRDDAGTLKPLPVALGANERVAVFNHRFDASAPFNANSTKHGVFKF